MTSSVSLNEPPSLNNGPEPMELSPDSPSSPVNPVGEVAHNTLARSSTAENQGPLPTLSGTNGCVSSLPPKQIQNEPSLTREQQFLLNSLGIIDPSKEENKERNTKRINTILECLKESTVLTASEKKAAFFSLSAEALLSSSFFYDFLQLADRHNLVLLFEEKLSLPDETPFSKKIGAVLRYLEENKEEKIDLSVRSWSITGIPEKVCNLNNLKTLFLVRAPIVSLPEEIGDLTNLETFFFDYVRIKSLPGTIGRLKKLSTLFLSDANLKRLPEEIGGLTNLEMLSLGNTPIESLPNTIGRLEKLSHLDLSNTKIKHLPEEIGGLTNLETLDLFSSSIESLPITIGRLKS